MALFGEKKFGTFTFGPTVLDRPCFALEIDWDQDGLFDGRNDGIYLNSFSVEAGRRYFIRSDGQGFEQEDTGRLLATLVDEHRDYDPYNTASPLYPNVGPGRLFRARVRTESDVIYPLMAGVIEEPTIQADSAVMMVSLSGADGWKVLRDPKSQITIELQQNIAADEAMRLVLDKIGWPATWGEDLQRGVDRHPYWWVSDQSAATAIHDLAHSELGKIYMAPDGKLTFRNRHYFDAPTVTLTKSEIAHGTLELRMPWDVVRNAVRAVATPREPQADAVLWRLGTPIRVDPGKSVSIFTEWTYNNEKCPAQNVQQPEATTDYLANTSADGTGTDLTANFSQSLAAYSTWGKLTVANNGSVIGYLWFSTVRGDAIAASSRVPFQFDDAASQARLKQVRSFTLETDWLQNPRAARAAGAYLIGILPIEERYPAFDLTPNPDVQFQLALGTRVHLYLPDDGIDAEYRVHFVRHSFMDDAGILSRTSVMLEPARVLDPDIWIVPHTVPMKVGY